MIPLYKTRYPYDMGEILQSVFDSGMTSEGPEAALFQLELQDWMETPYVALTSSGTVALTMAGRLAGVGPGDEVIASPVTCLAGTEWIISLGATPVWCDIDPNTCCIDHTQIEKLITSKTKAITFVDWAGTPAELDAIQAIADKHGIKTIEDAAQSMGALYKGKKVGSVCDYTIHSFQSIKILSTVDGGCLACKTKDDYDRAILLRWFGLARGQNSHPIDWVGDVTEPGYKAHMNDVNAAIGRKQLRYVDSLILKHRQNAKYLREEIKGLTPDILIPQIPEHISSIYWVFTIRCKDRAHRALVSEALIKAGIGNNISHVRNDTYSLFDNYRKPLPNVDLVEDQRLNIPCGWWCEYTDILYIATILKQIL